MKIESYTHTNHDIEEMCRLLRKVYVEGHFTDSKVADKAFTPEEVCKRGHILFARDEFNQILGMIICATSSNPYKQVANDNEAEMQLLAVSPITRGKGVGQALCLAFENWAIQNGYHHLVLSTQESMKPAHRLYERLNYQRNPARDWNRNDRQFIVYEKALK